MRKRRHATGRATLERENPQVRVTAQQLQELATKRQAHVIVQAAVAFPGWAMAPRPGKPASAAAAAGRISQAAAPAAGKAAAAGIVAEAVVVAAAVEAVVADADQPCQSNLRRIR